VYDFISRINIPTDDLLALMSQYSNSIKPGSNPKVDEFVPRIACDWIKNSIRVHSHSGEYTGTNSAKWARWIPRICPKGESFDKAAGECRPCRAGEYSPEGWKCLRCGPGTFSPKPNMSVCHLCDQGEWQDSSGGTTCEKCPAGYRRSASDHGCLRCTPGHFSAFAGSPICKRCDLGSWMSKGGSTECLRCHGNLTTMREAATTEVECVCLEGTYVPCKIGLNGAICNVTGGCRACPLGMQCNGGILPDQSSPMHAQPLVFPGHFAKEDDPFHAFKCHHAGKLCLGQLNSSMAAIGQQQQCGGGRVGLQCFACADGNTAPKGEVCQDCTSSGTYFLLPVCILLGFICLGVVYVLSAGKKDRSPSKTAMVGTLSIMLLNMQMLSIVVSFSIEWPTVFNDLFGWLEIFSFNVDGPFSASACYFGYSGMGPKYLPGLMLPIGITGMMLVMWVSSQLLARYHSRFHGMKLDQSLNALGMILMSLYVAVCKAVFNIFECRTNPSATKTLRSHDGFLCLGNDVMKMVPASMVGALLYIVAFNALYIWVIARAPSAYQHQASFRLSTDFLLRRWHPEFWFWGILFTLRNLLCSLIPTILTSGNEQCCLMFAIMLPMFVAQVRVWPWREEMANKHDLIMGTALLLVLMASLGLQTGPTGTWKYLLEVVSTFSFVFALLVCGVILGGFLMVEAKTNAQQRLSDIDSTESLTLPTIIGRISVNSKSGKDREGGTGSDLVHGSGSVGRPSGSDSHAEKINQICDVLNQLNRRSSDDDVRELVMQLGDEMPSADLKKLQWGMSLIGYHILGDTSKKPTGIALSPASSRRRSTRTSPRESNKGGDDDKEVPSISV